MSEARFPHALATRSYRRGFTLLEVLVAVAIFAIAAQLTFGGLRNILHAREQLAPRHEAASSLRYAVSILDQDLTAAAPRVVRDALGDPAPAMLAGGRDELVMFSRRDPARPVLLDAVGIYRVSYRLREGELLREVWPVIDAVQSTQPASQVLLDGVRELRLRFLSAGGDGNWVDLWPVSDGDLAALPRAIEFELVFDDGTTLRRLLLPGSGA